MPLDRRNVVTLLLIASIMPAGAQDATIQVVTSFSILGDLVRQIGGDRVKVTELVGPNQDAHVFQPKPGDAKTLGGAQVIIVNGLGFEPFLDRLIKTSGTQLKPIIASAGIEPLAGADNHGHGKNIDPHAWQSIANVKAYVKNIAAALAAADPNGAATYSARLTDYLAQLDALDLDIRASIAKIPEERRFLATTHDAFGYFARAYGIAFQSLQGVSTDSEPSAADLARIIRQIRARNAPAVFLENVIDPRKAQRIAAESGAKVGGTLYSDSLSLANGPAATYIGMMRHNIKQLTDALIP